MDAPTGWSIVVFFVCLCIAFCAYLNYKLEKDKIK